MAVLEIARLGHPVLRKKAQPVDGQDLTAPGSEIQTLIDDMIETMRRTGGVGLAAPQVSRSLRIVVLEYQDNERYPGNPPIPLTVLVNPVLTRISEDTAPGWESCLSLVDFRGLVTRATEVTVEGIDRRGKKRSIEAKGFHAVVLQHEIDHLDGKLFIDRMTDLTQLAYTEEFEKYWANKEVVTA